MVEQVTGFLTSESKFYDNVVDARYHEAVYQLRNNYKKSIYQGSIDIEQMLSIISLLSKETIEFLQAQVDYLAPETETSHDTDQEPVAVES